MRICYLSVGERFAYGVIASQVAALLGKLTVTHRIDWYALLPPHGMLDRSFGSERPAGLRVFRAPIPGRNIWMTQQRAALLASVATKLLSGRAGVYDLIHSRSYPAAVVAARLSQQLGIPWVFDPRGVYPHELCLIYPRLGLREYRNWSKVERGLWSESSARICVSEAMRDYFETTHGPAAAVVVPCTGGQPPLLVDKDPSGILRLCYVGTLGSWTLPSDLANMVLDLEQVLAGAEYELTIITPSLTSTASAQLEFSELKAKRVVSQHVKPESVPSLLATQDIGLLPRGRSLINSVAWPVKASEYALAGLKVALWPGTSGCESFLREVGALVPVQPRGALTDEATLAPDLDLASRRQRQTLAAELVSLEATAARVSRLWQDTAVQGGVH